MPILRFPPVELADEHGLLAVGGDLEVETLLAAYRSGIFPWPLVGVKELTWFAPPERSILFLKKFSVPRSLRKLRTNGKFSCRIDSCFAAVISACAKSANRSGDPGTWIRPDIISAYTKMHHAGYCHSIETFLENDLTGGLYGISIGQMFAGESMFYRQPNASKLALWYLVDLLRGQGIEWIDCQQQTALVASFGAELVPRARYMKMLAEVIDGPSLSFK